ncbi:MAG: thioredoxin domain-containing protein [Actinomycetota bacterium]|nr:thioredoxin domain-containing protein [Actinomycetota bacterium]
MGGAERSARKKRQNQVAAGAKTVASARGGGDRKKVIIAVVAAVLIAGAVIGGVIYTNNQKNATEAQTIGVAPAGISAPVKRVDGVVEVGEDTAKVTLDVYEDFLCPACATFEGEHAAEIEKKIDEGTLKVRYHMVNMLNEKSDPAGYSTDAANAALLAADDGKFLRFHKSLFISQPEEGARGWSKDQLIGLGTAIGITNPAFADGIRSGKYDAMVTAGFENARNAEHLQQEYGNGQKGFGTPTLAANDKVIDTESPTWLDDLVKAPQT